MKENNFQNKNKKKFKINLKNKKIKKKYYIQKILW